MVQSGRKSLMLNIIAEMLTVMWQWCHDKELNTFSYPAPSGNVLCASPHGGSVEFSLLLTLLCPNEKSLTGSWPEKLKCWWSEKFPDWLKDSLAQVWVLINHWCQKYLTFILCSLFYASKLIKLNQRVKTNIFMWSIFTLKQWPHRM